MHKNQGELPKLAQSAKNHPICPPCLAFHRECIIYLGALYKELSLAEDKSNVLLKIFSTNTKLDGLAWVGKLKVIHETKLFVKV